MGHCMCHQAYREIEGEREREREKQTDRNRDRDRDRGERGERRERRERERERETQEDIPSQAKLQGISRHRRLASDLRLEGVREGSYERCRPGGERERKREKEGTPYHRQGSREYPSTGDSHQTCDWRVYERCRPGGERERERERGHPITGKTPLSLSSISLLSSPSVFQSTLCRHHPKHLAQGGRDSNVFWPGQMCLLAKTNMSSSQDST